SLPPNRPPCRLGRCTSFHAQLPKRSEPGFPRFAERPELGSGPSGRRDGIVLRGSEPGERPPLGRRASQNRKDRHRIPSLLWVLRDSVGEPDGQASGLVPCQREAPALMPADSASLGAGNPAP